MNSEKIETINPFATTLQNTQTTHMPERSQGVSVAISGNATFAQIRPFLSGKSIHEPVRPKPKEV